MQILSSIQRVFSESSYLHKQHRWAPFWQCPSLVLGCPHYQTMWTGSLINLIWNENKVLLNMQHHNWATTWDFQQCGMCDQPRLRAACAYAQSDQSLCSSLEYSMNIKLLTGHYLEFLTLKGGCTGSSESIHVKMLHLWKSHVEAQLRR